MVTTSGACVVSRIGKKMSCRLGPGSQGWLTAAVCLALAADGLAQNPSGDLRIEVIAAYNLVVDSNVESPSTYAPRSAYLGAKFYNDGVNDMTNVFAYIGTVSSNTPGIYPSRPHSPLVGFPPTGEFSLTHEGGSAGLSDATRYIGTIPAGGYVTVYWLVSYPNVDANGDAVWGPSIKPDDDLWLNYDIWATAKDSGADLTASVTRKVTMRNEISAMANKIYPNTASKVPNMYLDLLNQYQPSWTNLYSDGTPGTRIWSEGVWYDLGNVGDGFDNDGDLVPDKNAWLQPVGDPTLFDAGAFRLVRTHTMVVIKLKSGGELVYMVDDQLYFQNIPENNGAVGLVQYEFLPLKSGASSQISPYQEVASGFDNEKFNGDYGATLGTVLSSGTSKVEMDKTVSAAVSWPGSNLLYRISFTNSGTVAVGDITLNMPLVVQDSIPTGTTYVAGSATNSNVFPTGVTAYAVLFSTNGGNSWVNYEPSPATNVTGIQWWLNNTLAASAAGSVSFSVTIGNATNTRARIDNIGALSFGGSSPFVQTNVSTLVSGTNRLGDMVFRDDGSGGGILGNGIKDGTEPGISNVTVSLYYDANSNGTVDSIDLFLTSTLSGTNGVYMFYSLFDGMYISQVDLDDSDIPYGYTRSTSPLYSVDLDAPRTNGTPVVYTNADFGFAPALTVTKQRLGISPVREGTNVTFTISVTNRLAGNGGYAEHIIWATNLEAGSKWDFPSNAVGLPDEVYASAPLAASKKETMDLNGYSIAQQNGDIIKVEMYIPIVVNPLNPGDNIDFAFLDGAAVLFTTNKPVETMTTGMLVLDVTSLRSWVWSNFGSTNQLTSRLVSNKSGAGGSVFLADAAALRITTSWSGSSDPVQTLDPVPLTDTYNASNLQFVSASVTPTSVETNGYLGTLSWDDVGPVYPGSSANISVTFKTLAPLNVATSGIATNTASVVGATYATGKPANSDTGSATVAVLQAGEVGDYVWWDLNTNGVKDVSEGGIPGVSVVLYSTNITGRITNVTDQTGYYLFWGLPSNGVYRVIVLTNSITGGAVTNTWDEDGGNNSSNVVAFGSLTNHLTSDFGYKYVLFSNIIEGTVWNDLNWNGASLPDSGEPWLTNVTVRLFTNSAGTGTVITNRTSTNGFFRFAGNYSGNYWIRVTTNSGMMTNLTWTETFDTDGKGTADVATFAITGGVRYARVDFSYALSGPYSVGDTLFYDWNGDGSQETNEGGVINVPVSLYVDVNTNNVFNFGVDRLIATTTTVANGFYTFTNLVSSNYLVVVDLTSTNLPPLYRITADPYGANDARSSVRITTAINTNQDFGFQPYGTGSIGDTVWRDMNGDRLKSGSQETGITNVTVTLLVDFNRDGIYDAVSTTRTDSAGSYLFSNLPDADYKVQISTNDSFIPADPFGIRYFPTTPTNYPVSITNGSTYLDADFGFIPPGAIGDTIFWDANQNGTQDFTEKGVSNVTVSLYRDLNSNGLYDVGETFVTNRVTATNGLYLFTGVTTGRYVVVVTTNSGPLAGTLCSSDPDGDGVAFSNCNSQVAVRVNPGTSFMGADFGYVPSGVIGDTVWIDMDNDGVRDSSESGIPYITVQLWTNGTVTATTETDADGYYYFSGCPNATYKVVVSTNDTDFPAGLVPTYDVEGILDNQATSIVVSAGHIFSIAGVLKTNADLTVDFGYRYFGTNVLSGTVGLDGTPTNGVLGAGASGVSADEIPFGNVPVYLTFWADDGDNVIEPGETRLISSTATSTNGDYSFTGLPAGDGNDKYIVSLSAPDTYLLLTTTNGLTPAAWVSNTVGAAGYSMSSYQVITNLVPVTTNIDFAYYSVFVYDFGDLPSSYGTRMQDTPPGPQHRVRTVPNLYLGASVDTEPNGQPSVNADGDGADENGVIAAGAWLSGTNQVRVTVGAGSGWLAGFVDFNNDGDMMDAGELVISRAASPGVITNSFVVPSTAFSGTNTTYLYARFRLLPTQPAFPELAYSGKADNGEVEDYRWAFGAIGDHVWKDVNADGVQDPGEPGLAGVRVFIDANGDGVWQTNSEASAVTDSSGYYGIGGLCTGTYTVVVSTNTIPYPGLVQTYGLDLPGSTNKAVVAITTNGQVRLDADFGYMGMALGGRAWYDSNTNGIQDEGASSGVSNILVRLYDSGTNWIGTSYTGTNGTYFFDITVPGSYSLEFFPIGYLISPRDQGGVDTSDSDVSTNAPYRTVVTTIAVGERQLYWDMGIYRPAYSNYVGDRVWFDADRDGVQDPDESGVANITVGLYDSQTNLLRTTLTDVEGYYYFAGLTPTNYVLHFSKPADYFYTLRDMTAESADSDINPATGYTDPFPMAQGQVNTNMDAGMYALVDVGVAKVVNNSTPEELESIWFTITVSNRGPSAATGVQLTDLWPTNITYTGSGATKGAYTPAAGLWNVGTLTNGESGYLSITGTVNVGTTGTALTNSISVSHINEPDTNGANDSATAKVSVAGMDISVTKVVNNTAPFEGSNITYTITATNLGPKNASGVVLTDLLPATLTYVTNSATMGVYNDTTGEWAIGALSASNGAILTIQATVKTGTGGSHITNTVSRTASTPVDVNPANDSASAVVVVRAADLGVTKAVSKSQPGTNETVIYTIAVTNYGPNDANNVSVTDPLTNGITYVTHTASTGSYTSGSGVWNVGSLAVGSGAVLTITALVEADALGMTITNRSAVSGSDMPDHNPANDFATAVINVTDFRISKRSDVASYVDPGSNITYTIIVTNAGKAAHASVTVTDPLPAGVAYVADSSVIVGPVTSNDTVRDEFNAQAYTNQNGTVKWTRNWQETNDDNSVIAGGAQVAADGTNIYALYLSGTGPGSIPGVWRTADLSTYRNGMLSFAYRRQGLTYDGNYVAVYASSNGPGNWVEIGRVAGPDNDSVYQSTNISISLYMSTNTAIMFQASGMRDSQGKMIYVDNVQLGFEKRMVVTNSAGAPPDMAGGRTLEGGEYLKITYQTTVDGHPACLVITNTASVMSSVLDTPLSDTTRDPVHAVDLGLTKVANDAKIGTNSVVWYTITVTNSGPHTATSCVVTDLWPSVVIYSNHLASKGTYDSATRLWTIGTMTVGSYETLIVTGRLSGVTNAVNVTNTAWVSCMQYDPNKNNNTGGVSIITLAVVSRLDAFEESGSVVVEWETVSEVDTAGFWLNRVDKAGRRTRVNSDLIAAIPGTAQGSTYRLTDPAALPGGSYEYELEEVEGNGRVNVYGPYKVAVRAAGVRQSASRVVSVAPPVRVRQSAEKAGRLKTKVAKASGGGGLTLDVVTISRKPSPVTASRLRVMVKDRGVYYVDAGTISTMLGLQPAEAARLISTGGLSFETGGADVSYLPAVEGAGLYFFGEGPKGLYSTAQAYWIAIGKGKKMTSAGGGNPAPVTAEQFYRETKHFEESKYAVTALTTDPDADYWMWEYVSAGNSSVGVRQFNLRLESVAAAGGEAALTVRLHGATASGVADEHSALVKVNGTDVGGVTWTGKEPSVATLRFAQGLLVTGDNQVQITGVLRAGVPYSVFYVNSFDVAYGRKYEAPGGQAIVRADGNEVVTVGGFGSGGITVLSLKDPAAPKVMEGAVIETAEGLSTASFVPSGPDVEYAVFDTAKVPAGVYSGGGGLLSAGNSADYVIVTVPELVAAATALADYRAGKGLIVKVVTLQDIYDDFSYGMVDPAAIKTFIAYARQNWVVAPRYVLLAGEGTYDYKGYLGVTDNVVPVKLVSTPQGLFASDSYFGDADCDGVPEVAIGRLPVMNATELQAQVQKIIGYETSGAADWKKRVLLSADTPVAGADFTSGSEQLAGVIPPEFGVNRVYLSQYALAAARTELLGQLNSGALLMNYYGHAGMDRLSQKGLLVSGDVASLANGSSLPVLTAMSCVIGRFEIPGYDCLAETLVLKQGGGAVAVWSPTGLSKDDDARALAELFYAEVLGRKTAVLGDVVTRTLAGYKAQSRMNYMLGIYNLLGDPGLLIAGMPVGAKIYGESDANVDSVDKWKRLHFNAQELLDPALSGDKADADNDGIANLLEYAQGRNPKRVDGDAVFDFGGLTDGTGYDAEIKFKRRKLASDLLWHVEVSPDLKVWLEGGGVAVESGVSDDGNGVTETVKYKIKSPAPDGRQAFIRLRVERTR
ncbi:MAG: hypothetical protein C0404_01200 [Verrucomicrobia bacterium]|nr:hypothetical protein [Verrucomicrobiota bacterium]